MKMMMMMIIDEVMKKKRVSMDRCAMKSLWLKKCIRFTWVAYVSLAWKKADFIIRIFLRREY